MIRIIVILLTSCRVVDFSFYFSKIKELLEKLAETQVLLDKTSREKASAQAELEIVRTQLSTNDLDYSKVRPVLLSFNRIF